MARSTSALLDRWVAAGLLDPGQADRLRAYERTSRRTTARGLVPEALGYTGGVLVMVAVVLFAARYWEVLGVVGRQSVTVGAAALLALSGAIAVRRRRDGRMDGRLDGLRSVLWLLSAASTAGALAVLGHDVLTWTSGRVVLLSAAGSGLYAVALWRWSRTIPQQVAVFGALAVTAGAAFAQLPIDDAEGARFAIVMPVWAVSMGWLLLMPVRLRSRHTARVLGGVGALVASLIGTEFWWGHVLGLGTVTALVLIGVLARNLPVLAIGTAGMLIVVPATLIRYFPGAVAAPLAVLFVGAMLVAGGLRLARRP